MQHPPPISGQVGPLVTADEIRNKGPKDLEESKRCRVPVLEIQIAFQLPVQENSEDQL